MNGGDWLQLLLMLLCMGAILFFAYWVSKQMFTGKLSSMITSGKQMRVLDRMMLSQSKMLIVCQIGAGVYVLSVCEHSISLVAELTDEQAAPWLCEAEEQKPQMSFAEVFKTMFQQNDKKR